MHNLFQTQDIILHSGIKSDFKIECDTLWEADWETIARQISHRCGPFEEVVGVPRGGLMLANCLYPYRWKNTGPTLVVDDVLTTGGSILEVMQKYKDHRAGVKGWVVFARLPCPPGVRALFQMN